MGHHHHFETTWIERYGKIPVNMKLWKRNENSQNIRTKQNNNSLILIHWKNFPLLLIQKKK